MCPESSSNSLMTSAFTRFPLWAIAISPSLNLLKSGCAFFNSLPPVVEYLTCPMAE